LTELTYPEKRACSDVMTLLLRYNRMPVRIFVKPDVDRRKAANQQAQYGLLEVDKRCQNDSQSPYSRFSASARSPWPSDGA
jgi:hypothetical protein